MRRPVLCVVVLSTLLVPKVGRAQQPAHASVTAAPLIGCDLPATSDPLLVSLPLPLLDHLKPRARSPFVHAFLIGLIADTSAGQHRLSRCARSFVAASPTQLDTLRARMPDGEAIVDALRAAELTRQRVQGIADSLRLTIGAAVTILRRDARVTNMDSAFDGLAASVCRADRGEACRAAHSLVDSANTLRLARAEAARAGEVADLARAGSTSVRERLGDAQRQLGNETRTLDLAKIDSTFPPAALDEIRKRIRAFEDSVRTLKAALGTAEARDTMAADSVKRATSKLTAARGALAGAFTSFETALAARPTLEASKAIIEGSDIVTRIPLAEAPPAIGVASSPSIPSADIMLQLTDFIITRAKQEAVNSFIINLYKVIDAQPLMKFGFPDTWALMSGLGRRGEKTLNAVAVGRIPMNTWRSTIAGDFITLPANLIERGPSALCRDSASELVIAPPRAPSGANTPSDSARESLLRVIADRAAERRAACRARVATLRPVAPLARRLLQGDPVFDILHDAAALPADPDVPADWTRVQAGLAIVGALTEASAMQGRVPNVDIARHPYVLTARTISDAPLAQRSAFLNLLVMLAVPSGATTPKDIDALALWGAVNDEVRLLDRLANLPAGAGVRSADAAQVARMSFAVLGGATRLSRAFASGSSAEGLDSIAGRWLAVSSTVEPLVAGNYGLALSRSMVFLRSLTGVDVPASVITLTALASALSDASNGDQIRVAFEAAASPVGGWQGKRYGEGGASITALPGGGAGAEWLVTRGEKEDSLGRVAATYGVSLPVGIEWMQRRVGDDGVATPGCHRAAVCGIGVFVPIIDLGALLSYRVGGASDVRPDPNTTFRQVFAPGLYASLAFSRTIPLNMLAGVQFMPALRTVDSPTNPGTRSAFRFGINLGMDVMLFKF